MYNLVSEHVFPWLRTLGGNGRWKEREGKERESATAGCRPKLDFLDCLKAAAERANLEPKNFCFTSSARLSRRAICRRASISLRCKNGSGIVTLRARCAT